MEKFKKHKSHMDGIEAGVVRMAVRRAKPDRFILHDHVFRKLDARMRRNGMRASSKHVVIEQSLRSFDVVEVHNEASNGNIRVLIRSNVPFNGANICMVLDMEDRTIVTIYMNNDSDDHKTLDESRYYNTGIDLTEYF